MKLCAFVAVVVAVLSACARGTPPARLLLGANARDLGGGPDRNGIALREASPANEPVAATASAAARTGSGQFTFEARQLLLGFEVESGVFDANGSSFGGAYGVLGAEHATGLGSIGVEVVGGWRGLRYKEDGVTRSQVNTLVAEPRVRAQLRLAPQLNLGAVVGTTFGADGSWVAGVYLGVLSRVFGE